MSPVESRIRAALELRGLTIAMRREALRREYPDDSAEQLERRVRAWVLQVEVPCRSHPTTGLLL